MLCEHCVFGGLLSLCVFIYFFKEKNKLVLQCTQPLLFYIHTDSHLIGLNPCTLSLAGIAQQRLLENWLDSVQHLACAVQAVLQG